MCVSTDGIGTPQKSIVSYQLSVPLALQIYWHCRVCGSSLIVRMALLSQSSLVRFGVAWCLERIGVTSHSNFNAHISFKTEIYGYLHFVPLR